MGCLPISRPLASRRALILLPIFEIVDHLRHADSTRKWALGMLRNAERGLSLLEVCESKRLYHLGFLDGVVRNPICSQLHRNDGNIMLCQTTGMKTGQAPSLIAANPRRLPTSPRILPLKKQTPVFSQLHRNDKNIMCNRIPSPPAPAPRVAQGLPSRKQARRRVCVTPRGDPAAQACQWREPYGPRHMVSITRL